MRPIPQRLTVVITALLLGLPATLATADGARVRSSDDPPRSPAANRPSPPPRSSSPPPRVDTGSGTRVEDGTRNVRPPYRRPPRYRHRPPYYPTYPGWGYYGYPYSRWSWYGYWGFPYYWGWSARTVHTVRSESEAAGALDLDVSPEEARVIVSGQLLGSCDDFDGYPEYLWLPEGLYEISFVLEGYETRTEQVEVVAGLVQRFDFRLVRGESVLPPLAPPPGEPEEIEAVEGEPARLHLELHPGDASVYLDGRFLGTAEELDRLHSGLVLGAGRHVLQVVRPGFAPEERRIEAEAGERIELEVRLEPSRAAAAEES